MKRRPTAAYAAAAAIASCVVAAGLLAIRAAPPWTICTIDPRHVVGPMLDRDNAPTIEARCAAVDLFGSQIDWNELPFLELAWPTTHSESMQMGVMLGGFPATPVAGRDALAASPPEQTAFTLVGGQSLLVSLGSAPRGTPIDVVLPLRPTLGAVWLAALAAIASVVLLLTASWWVRPSRRETALAALCVALATVGSFLLGANVVGLLTAPLRAPFDSAKLGCGFGPLDRPLEWSQVEPMLARKPNEGETAFVVRLNDVVSSAVGHAWIGSRRHELRMQVPLTENWVLWLGAEIDPRLRAYPFADPRKTLERGIGLCSHVSRAARTLLCDAGVDARLVQLGGHTVVTARADDRWLILDPDFGAAIDHSITELEADPSRAAPAYRAAFAALELPHSEAEIERLVRLYDEPGNAVEQPGDVDPLALLHRRGEALADFAKWAVPLAALAPALLWVAMRRRRQA